MKTYLHNGERIQAYNKFSSAMRFEHVRIDSQAVNWKYF